MIESVLHLFKIQRKVIFGNPSVIIQDMFPKTPKPFDAVNMIFAFASKCFAVVQPVVLAALQFRHIVDRFSQALVHSRDRLIVHFKIMRQLVGGLRLVEALQDTDLAAKLPERLLFSTAFVSALRVATPRAIDLERTTENALPASRKVGRTTENVFLPLHHMDILVSYGYDSH